MTEWKIVYTENALRDLRDIYEYIAFSLLEPKVAQNQYDRIISAIDSLEQLPLRHRVYEDEPWHSKGLRILTISNYIVFYLPNQENETVAVVRIMYGGRNLADQLFYTDEI